MADETTEREELLDSEVAPSDYVFIVDGDGDLKAVFMPTEEAYQIPDKAKKVFKIFGIKNPESVSVCTIH